ncbi:UbiA-like protein EboC [Leptospira sp. 2 VSF19]|uniref:UbiA-like protein EboC n=1 Tax=Leptospira soteropolitanensis TaxID=2950025 RepID=A0AAW5VPY8_9LEPT|nr:UbiA-like protein EboC [Leptospira soteropolitanensis]MCW7493606.1 UbiA-like protein EboC [Leptospira soteropolitanensis]MCW7501205.1 UbiA-like protein EboC [Leptospira soteropolitanensis]MCW7523609.1 UbiA-like protein EboC [Leptospira soteropolitanensis]MCW7527318.1 UbiA-like protein EboC [Leptospira soteropolitanensis]MCW7531175.1 UbiA-like protein EboC [Leptospira soteropolitanensis]
MNLKAYLTLFRPANVVTAVADILAGMAIVGFVWRDHSPIFLLLSTIGLYGGGVVLNDYFDIEIDTKERPERPIPSGKVKKISALVFGSLLLVVGLGFAFFYQMQSGWIALGIIVLVLTYNRFAKHHSVFGPVVMGMCRGGNLILGMSLVSEIKTFEIALSLLPIFYIIAITMVSRGEVHGGKKLPLLFAGVLYLIVFLCISILSFQLGHLMKSSPFVVLHITMVFPPLLRAYRNPIGPMIGKAVKMGVITLILLNASFAASFGFISVAIVIFCLLPLSLVLAKTFSVT